MFLGRPDEAAGGVSTIASTREYFDKAVRETAAVSAPLPLVGGKKYYISAINVNRQGRDALSVSVSGGPFTGHAPIPAEYDGKTVLSYDGDLAVCDMSPASGR